MPTLTTQGEQLFLPLPQERPGSDVVLYDSHCELCLTQMRRLARLDTGRRLAYLPLDDAEVRRRWPGLSLEALLKEMHVIDRHGRAYKGAEAFRYLSARLPRLWWLAPLLHLPGSMPLWSYLYKQVAKRRYRFAKCSGGTCRLKAV